MQLELPKFHLRRLEGMTDMRDMWLDGTSFAVTSAFAASPSVTIALSTLYVCTFSARSRFIDHAVDTRYLYNTRKNDGIGTSALLALGPWAPPAERGPSLESIYRVSLAVDLCEGNKIISLKKLFHHSQLGPLKKKKSGGPGHVPSVPIG